MSGGHFNYAGARVRNELEGIGQDEDVMQRWPMTGRILTNLAEVIYDAEYVMDWDLSGDSRIEDDAEFDKRTAFAVFNVIFEGINPQPNSKKKGS